MDDRFCIGHCFMGIHYWQELRETYEQVRADVAIPSAGELNWRSLLRQTGVAQHMDDAMSLDFVRTLVDAIKSRSLQGCRCHRAQGERLSPEELHP
jgi:hypothetical protein